MALLAGRGGADGQGIIRRVRDPNASSGQRQVILSFFRRCLFWHQVPRVPPRVDTSSFGPEVALSGRAQF